MSGQCCLLETRFFIFCECTLNCNWIVLFWIIDKDKFFLDASIYWKKFKMNACNKSFKTGKLSNYYLLVQKSCLSLNVSVMPGHKIKFKPIKNKYHCYGWSKVNWYFEKFLFYKIKKWFSQDDISKWVCVYKSKFSLFVLEVN